MILSDVQMLLLQFRTAFSRQKSYAMFVAVLLRFLTSAAEKHMTYL